MTNKNPEELVKAEAELLEYFGTDLKEYGHYRFFFENGQMKRTWNKFSDLPFHPEELTNGLAKGETIFYQGGGFTVFGISGSCKDERPGCKSIFFIKNIITQERLIEIIRFTPAAYELITAMPFEVKWNTRTLQRAEQEKVGKPLSLMDTSNKQRLITAMEEYASQKSPEPATAEGLRKQYERENPNWMTVPPVTDLKRFITWLEQKLISRGEGK